MELQLSVVVVITPDEKQVRLVTTGHLTPTNQQMLHPLIRRAWGLTPDTEVIVDLSAVEPLDTAALELLSEEIEHDKPRHPTHLVRFLLPAPPVADGPPSALGDTP